MDLNDKTELQVKWCKRIL